MFLASALLLMLAPTQTPQPFRLYSIGHSLSAEMPDMLAALAAQDGQKLEFQEQFRLGASLQYQWDEATEPRDQYDDPQFRVSYPKALGKGKFDAVVLIDSVPRGGKEQEEQSIEYLAKFASLIKQKHPEAKIFYCEAWHSIKSGTGEAQWDTASPTRHLSWRKRIDADAPMWERIRKAAEQKSGAKIKMIREAQALGALADAVEAGKVPGFKSLQDIFEDDIHLKPPTMYFLACVQYAAILGRSPVGKSTDIKGRWGAKFFGEKFWNGKTYTAPSAEAAKQMQAIAAKFAD